MFCIRQNMLRDVYGRAGPIFSDQSINNFLGDILLTVLNIAVREGHHTKYHQNKMLHQRVFSVSWPIELCTHVVRLW